MRRPALRWGPPRASSNLGWPAGDRQSDNGLSEALIVALFQAAPGPSCAADLLEFRGLPLGTGTRGWAGRGSGSSGLETTAAAEIAVVADRPASTPNSGRSGSRDTCATRRSLRCHEWPWRLFGRRHFSSCPAGTQAESGTPRWGTAASRPLRARPQIAMPVPIPPPPSYHDGTRPTASRTAAVSSLSTDWPFMCGHPVDALGSEALHGTGWRVLPLGRPRPTSRMVACRPAG